MAKRSVRRVVYASIMVFVSMPRSEAYAGFGLGISKNTSYVNPGLVVGGTTTIDGGTGFVIGGEITALRSGEALGLIGASTDLAFDTRRKTGRVFVGPLVGCVLWPGIRVRLDAGYLLEFNEDEVHHGGGIRLFVSVAALVGPYVGGGFLADAGDYVEFGLRLKFPFAL